MSMLAQVAPESIVARAGYICAQTLYWANFFADFIFLLCNYILNARCCLLHNSPLLTVVSLLCLGHNGTLITHWSHFNPVLSAWLHHYHALFFGSLTFNRVNIVAQDSSCPSERCDSHRQAGLGPASMAIFRRLQVMSCSASWLSQPQAAPKLEAVLCCVSQLHTIVSRVLSRLQKGGEKQHSATLLKAQSLPKDLEAITQINWLRRCYRSEMLLSCSF